MVAFVIYNYKNNTPYYDQPEVQLNNELLYCIINRDAKKNSIILLTKPISVGTMPNKGYLKLGNRKNTNSSERPIGRFKG